MLTDALPWYAVGGARAPARAPGTYGASTASTGGRQAEGVKGIEATGAAAAMDVGRAAAELGGGAVGSAARLGFTAAAAAHSGGVAAGSQEMGRMGREGQAVEDGAALGGSSATAASGAGDMAVGSGMRRPSAPTAEMVVMIGGSMGSGAGGSGGGGGAAAAGDDGAGEDVAMLESGSEGETEYDEGRNLRYYVPLYRTDL